MVVVVRRRCCFSSSSWPFVLVAVARRRRCLHDDPPQRRGDAGCPWLVAGVSSFVVAAAHGADVTDAAAVADCRTWLLLLMPPLLLLLLLWLPTTVASLALVKEDGDEDKYDAATTLHRELGRCW